MTYGSKEDRTEVKTRNRTDDRTGRNMRQIRGQD